MSALDITPAGLLVGFFAFVAVAALIVAVLAWRSMQRSRDGGTADGPDDVVIDLTYLERAIRADEEAVSRRRAERKPLFSQSPTAEPGRDRRLPTEER